MSTSKFEYDWPHATSHWTALSSQIASAVDVDTMCDAILACYRLVQDNGVISPVPTALPGLRQAISEMDQIEGFRFAERVLPALRNWALQIAAPGFFENERVEALVTGRPGAIRLTRLQARCLLALAFFCALHDMPDEPRKDARGVPLHIWGSATWLRLYYVTSTIGINRIKCHLNYFHHVIDTPPSGYVTFYRSVVAPEDTPNWAASDAAMCPLRLTHEKGIENSGAGIHVDFANEDLHFGCVIPNCTQEEILFSVRPELLIGLLFCDRMRPNEAIIMRGARRFSTYSGYLDTFRFTGSTADANDPAADLTQVIAIDAEIADPSSIQFEERCIARELCKAYAGFRGVPADVAALDDVPGCPDANLISTGMWGCGVFGNHPIVKFLQQVVVASVLRKSLTYCVFRKPALCEEHQALYDRMVEARVNPGWLVGVIRAYAGQDPAYFYRFVMGQLVGVLSSKTS